MALQSEQQQVLRALVRESRKIKDPRKRSVFLRAGAQVGKVETNYRNLSGGDADSAGWRQERASLYKDPTNLSASMSRFRKEFLQHYDNGEKSYQVAAQVQRPREDLRGRYHDEAKSSWKDLQSVMGGSVGGAVSGAKSNAKGFDVAAASAALGLGQEQAPLASSAPAAPAFAAQATAAAPPTAEGATGTPSLQVAPSQVVAKPKIEDAIAQLGSAVVADGQEKAELASDDGPAGDVYRRAKTIEAQKNPYLWGGGHQGKTKLNDDVDLDCSGAVSKVLGINPRVASQFKSVGRPGKGKVTIYARDDHVLMSITKNGKERFFGTSKSNPGGGAGFIPASALGKGYLSRFTVRHLPEYG